MANSDYFKRGGGSFATILYINGGMDHETDVVNFTRSRSNGQPITVGDALLVDDEIMAVTSVTSGSLGVKRGCADTTPALHLTNAAAWLLRGMVGTDRKEYSAGETVTAKISPLTIGGGELPVEKAPPLPVEFNWRFFRPYPPAQMKANGARWHVQAEINDTWPALALTWAHRDRILQADQLLGQDDPSLGPEPNTIYTMRVLDQEGTVVRTEVGLAGAAFNYSRAQALHDMGTPTIPYSASVKFCSTRDGFDSWQDYTIGFTVYPMAVIPSNFMPFLSAVIEAPYVMNLKAGQDDLNHAVAVAARPSDRQSDRFGMLVNNSELADGATSTYTPWLDTMYRLPELETTVTARDSSLFTGVTIDSRLIGKLAMIGTEFVLVDGILANGVTIKRGCCDSIPFSHPAGSRLWFVDGYSVRDIVPYPFGTDHEYRTPPDLYGAPVDPATLPVYHAKFVDRASKPYAPGRIVVNGRPWFEEAQATLGGTVDFSWARRNRLTQGQFVVDHTAADITPEAGQVTRLMFYYPTPSPVPGADPIVNVLRTVDVAGNAYSYPYDLALEDGNTAGTATGVCGTVVIYAFLVAVVDGNTSWQGYTIPIRVPSYPCT